jgi:hypothetical protein
MWHTLSYPLDKGIFMHTVEDSCIDVHNAYIEETYDVTSDSSSETNEIRIDPGGMALIDGEKSTITSADGTIFNINNEHITSAVIGYFSIEILDDALERYIVIKDLDSGYTSRMLREDIVKVYLPYSILVMRVDTYLDLAGELEKLYFKGINAYLGLASFMPDEYFIMGLGEALVSDEIGEA